jgi:DNA-binding MarR family transcriptional regulator
MDFGILVGLAYHSFVEELHAEFARRGFPITGASVGVMLRTLDQGAFNATQLGEKLGITTQGAAKVIDEMVAVGYVERRPDPADKRAKTLHLAERGKEALGLARGFHHEYEQRLTEQFGPEKMTALREILDHMINSPESTDYAKLYRPL